MNTGAELSRNITQLRNITIVLFDQAIHSGSNFLTGIIVGRVLSVGDFGEFSLGMSLLIFSLVFQDGLLATPYTYHLHRVSKALKPSLRASALLQSLLLALPCMIVLTLISFSGFLPGEKLGSIFIALAFSLPFIFLRECLRRQFFAEFKFNYALLLDLLVSLLHFSFLFFLWKNNWLSPQAVFVCMAGAAGIGVIFPMLSVFKDFNFKSINILEDTRKNIYYGRWLLAGSVCHFASLYAYPWIIFIVDGRAEAGAFAACFSLINLLNPFILGFNNYFRARIIKVHVENGAEKMHKLIRMACFAALAGGIVIIALLIACADFLITFFYGEDFFGLGFLLGLLSLSILPTMLGAPMQLGLLALNKPQYNPLFHALSLSITIIAGLPLTLIYANTGAAISYVMATTAGFALMVRLYKRALAEDIQSR